MNKLTERLVEFLDYQLNIETVETQLALNNIQKMQLNPITALINVENQIKVIILISYEQPLFDQIFQRYTADLNIEEHEKEDALIDSAGDIINIVVGNTLAEVDNKKHSVIMSPPLIIKDGKQIACKRDTLFYKANVITTQGQLDIYLISNTIGENDE